MSVTADKNRVKNKAIRANSSRGPSLENGIEQEAQDDRPDSDILVANKAASSGASSAELEQVQELLFGARSRDFQTQISNLEQLLQRSISDLRQHSDKRFSALTEKLEQIGEQLDNKISAEGRERLEQSAELQKSIEKTNQHIAHVESEGAQSQADLENRFFAQAEQLNQEFNARNEATLEKLEQVSASLTDKKTDRSVLAKLLKNMAQQIEADA